MPTIAVELEQYKQLETLAHEQQSKPDDVVREALRRYFWEQNRLKISEESTFYRQHHPELKQHYLGQYIAMHQGKVVDHDTDFQKLYQRVRGRFGKTPVMLTQVQEEPETTLVRRGGHPYRTIGHVTLPGVFVVGDDEGSEAILGGMSLTNYAWN